MTTGIESGSRFIQIPGEADPDSSHCEKDTYRIKEQLTISGTKESIGNILWKEVLSRRLDTRLEADTLKLQGELLVFCLLFYSFYLITLFDFVQGLIKNIYIFSFFIQKYTRYLLIPCIHCISSFFISHNP